MPIDVKIVPAREFIRTKANGEFDLEGTKVLFLSVFSKMKDANVSEVVMDVREASSQMTAFDIYELLSVLDHVGSWSAWKIAIVNRPKDDFDRAKFFELCAQNRGYQVGAFQEFEEAVAWLYPPQEA
jgi:hypothetical protein